MIIGSGLLARAFAQQYATTDSVCLYAAGVSNSSCTDAAEFLRERHRLSEALQRYAAVNAFVYFSTCSVADAEAMHTAYVQHKLAMEQLVAAHPHYLIVRLPQVVGITPNPHTLLNFLYGRIARSEAFKLWRYARRNIIDVADVAAIVTQLINHAEYRNRILNVANPVSYAMPEIVAALEKVTGKQAVCEVVEHGASYSIDIEPIRAVMTAADVKFAPDYLERVIQKYYGRTY